MQEPLECFVHLYKSSQFSIITCYYIIHRREEAGQMLCWFTYPADVTYHKLKGKPEDTGKIKDSKELF